MPVCVPRPVSFALGMVALIVGALLWSSCDGAGSKRASRYQRLTGTWTIEQLRGEIDPTLLDRRYDAVRLDFRGGDGERGYQMIGRVSGDSTRVLADGRISLPRSDSLQMTIPRAERLVAWSYTFEASRVVFTLRAGSRAFLTALFPQTSWGRSQAVTMTLAPAE